MCTYSLRTHNQIENAFHAQLGEHEKFCPENSVYKFTDKQIHIGVRCVCERMNERSRKHTVLSVLSSSSVFFYKLVMLCNENCWRLTNTISLLQKSREIYDFYHLSCVTHQLIYTLRYTIHQSNPYRNVWHFSMCIHVCVAVALQCMHYILES